VGGRGQSEVHKHAHCGPAAELTFITRENAMGVLDEYYASIGGRDKIMEESKAGVKGKKRGRPSAAGASTPNTTRTKRTKRASHPAESTPPASARKAWTPPAGSWEDQVASIEACHDENTGKLVVYLTWKNGHKTQHGTKVVYSRCPQKVGPHLGCIVWGFC
jgi:chromobox protein 1